MVSKPQIMFEGKAQSGEKAQHTRRYVSILSRLATQPSRIGGGFETTSKKAGWIISKGVLNFWTINSMLANTGVSGINVQKDLWFHSNTFLRMGGR